MASEGETKAAPGAASGQVFARQATGLVREIGIGSSVALNVSFMGIAYVVLVATTEPYAFPGGSLLWTTVIAAGLCVFCALLYGLLATAMPRAGGDYIYVSRILHPWAGLAANSNIWVWYTASTAYLAYLVPVLGMSSAFATLGVAGHSPTLIRWSGEVTSKHWSYGIAMGILVFIVIASSVSLSITLRVVRILFYASLAGVLLAIVLLAINSRSDFAHNVVRFGGNYNEVISNAHKAGYQANAGFSLKQTLLATPLAFAAFGYGIATAYTGGELKSSKRTALRGMLYALALVAGLMIVLMALVQRTVGTTFLGAATYLSSTGSSHYPFKAPAFFFFFVSMLTSSRLLIAIISISFIIATIATLPPSFLAGSRSIFAWSFDRLVPTRLSAVNSRTESPIAANILVFISAAVYLTFIAFGPSYFLGAFATLLLGQTLTFMTVAAAATVFAWRRKAIYEASPIVGSIGGIPRIAIVGAFAFVIYAFFCYALATTAGLGATTRTGREAVVIIVSFAIVFYPIVYMVNKARGIDIGAAFRELPPE